MASSRLTPLAVYQAGSRNPSAIRGPAAGHPLITGSQRVSLRMADGTVHDGDGDERQAGD